MTRYDKLNKISELASNKIDNNNCFKKLNKQIEKQNSEEMNCSSKASEFTSSKHVSFKDDVLINGVENEIFVKFRIGEWTNFHMAAYQDWSDDAIKSLDISLLNIPDPNDNRTPLHIASQYDNYRFIKTVVSFYELDINAIDDNGYTALHIAAKHGHDRCLSALILTNKIKLNFGGFDSPCALHLAVANEHFSCVRVLLQAGANVNASYGKKSKSSLHLAAKKGNEQICNYLVNYKPYNDISPACNPASVDSDGKTPLHYATFKNHKGVLEILIEAGAKINQRSSEGKTILHIAAERGFKNSVKFLLNLNIDKDAVDKWGMKAVEYAMEEGHDNIVGVLLDF